MSDSDTAQWFEPLGRCLRCGRLATGTLRNHRNATMGPYCRRCAEKRIKEAHRKGTFFPDAALTATPPREGGVDE